MLRTIRQIKRAATLSALKAVPVRSWCGLLKIPVIVPLYHLVSDANVPHVRHLYKFRSIREFEKDLDFFTRHFDPIDLETLARFTIAPPASSRPSFHLTFDDGFREIQEVVAPLLKRKGVPATFFLTTAILDGGGISHECKLSILIERLGARSISDVVRGEIEQVLGSPGSVLDLPAKVRALNVGDDARIEKVAYLLGIDFQEYINSIRPYLRSDEVVSLAKQGFSIGAHARDHLLFANLPLDEQLTQTSESVEFIAAKFGGKMRTFAFPYNDEGVGPEFFRRAFSENKLDLSFGTNGFINHFDLRNIERVVMERTPPDSRAILLSEFMRGYRHRFCS